eukprot:SAG25_NODE_710_length_5815_cov_9.003149_2_plen_167_part_00
MGLRGGTHHEIPEVSAVGLRSYVEVDAEACACGCVCVDVRARVCVCMCVCVRACVCACVRVGVWVCSPQPRPTPATPAAWPAFSPFRCCALCALPLLSVMLHVSRIMALFPSIPSLLVGASQTTPAICLAALALAMQCVRPLHCGACSSAASQGLTWPSRSSEQIF